MGSIFICVRTAATKLSSSDITYASYDSHVASPKLRSPNVAERWFQ